MKRDMTLRLILTAVLTAVFTGSLFAAGGKDVAETFKNEGLLSALLFAFSGGFAVSLTPCIYPMIPITLSVIGARSAQSTPLNGFLRSLVFVLGIAIVYTVLGMVVASFSGYTVGFLFRNKIFLACIALFFMVMGVSMMGYFNIQMPASVSAKLQGSGSKGGFLGAFLLGITTGIIASPCGSPFLVSILAVAGSKGTAAAGASLLFTYALGMGMLFLFLGTFPAFLNRIPKSGAWMDDVKKFLGVVLIGVGFYYLKDVFSNAVFWPLVVIALLVLAALTAIGSIKREKNPSLRLAWRAVGMVTVVAALYVGFTKIPPIFNGGKMEVKRGRGNTELTSGTVSTAGHDGATSASATVNGVPTDWIGEEEGLKLAKELGVPYVIDLGATWCAACKELEEKTFPIPAVEEALAGFVKIHIDCTEDAAPMEKYGAISLPTVLFFNKNGEPQKDLTLTEFESPEKFVERVKKVN